MMKLSETNQLVGPLVLRYYMGRSHSLVTPPAPKNPAWWWFMQARPQFPQLYKGIPTEPLFVDTRSWIFVPQKSYRNGFHRGSVLNSPAMDDHWDSGTLVNFFFGLRGKRKNKPMFHDVLEKWGGTYLQSWFLCARWFWSNNRSGGSFIPKCDKTLETATLVGQIPWA